MIASFLRITLWNEVIQRECIYAGPSISSFYEYEYLAHQSILFDIKAMHNEAVRVHRYNRGKWAMGTLFLEILNMECPICTSQQT